MICLQIPSIPPTINHAYFFVRKANKRVLSEEGKKYKLETKTYIAQHYPQELKAFQQNRPFSIIMEVTFPQEDLFNKGFPKTTQNRFQKLDASNRIKLFEDALVEAVGVDDKSFFFYGLGKTWGENPTTTVWAWSTEEEFDPIYDLLRNLRAARAQSHGALPDLP